CSTQRSLRLLRHHGEHSAATGVSPPSRADLAQVAGTSNARMAAHMGYITSTCSSPVIRCQRPGSSTATPDGTNLTHEEPDAGILLGRACGGRGGDRLAYRAYPGLPSAVTVRTRTASSGCASREAPAC